jgi:hypothetical protein
MNGVCNEQRYNHPSTNTFPDMRTIPITNIKYNKNHSHSMRKMTLR